MVKKLIDKQQYMRIKKERKAQRINVDQEGRVQLSLRRIKSLINCSKSKANRLMCSLEKQGKLIIKRSRIDGLVGRRVSKEDFMSDKVLFKGCFWSNGKVIKTKCNEYAFV